MKDLTGYIPEKIEVVIPSKYDKLPKTLFDGAVSMDDVKSVLHKEFVSTNEKVKVLRKLDAFEKSTIRSNYSELLEKKLPVVRDELARITEESKSAIKQAKEKLDACETNIEDLVQQVRDGNKEITFESENCYRIPVCGYYLYFSWVNNEFTLISVDPIPSWDADKIFSQGEKNVEAFKSVFGIDITLLIDERKAIQMKDGEIESDGLSQEEVDSLEYESRLEDEE